MFSAATKSGKNAAGSAVVTDPQFPLVTTLLHGDGTNGQTNNTFLDSSTNNFTITRTGNATQGTYTPYNSNWSNLFGTSNYVSFAMSQAFTTTTNFCVEAWLYPNTTTANEYYWFESIQPSLFFDSSLLPDNTIFIRIGSGTGSTLTTTRTVTINTWNHVAITYDGTTLRAFINGVASGSVAFTMFTATNTQCMIGYNNYAPAPRYFDGYISNWRMSVGTARYTTAFTPSTTPFVPDAYTVLLTAQSPNFVDTSYKANVVTVTGTPSVQRFSPFSPVTQTPISYSLYSTSSDYLTSATIGTTIGTGDYSLEGWVYVPNAAGTFQEFIKLNVSTTYTIYLQTSANQARFLDFQNPATNFVISGGTVNNNTWTHIAATRQSGTVRLFVNGMLVAYQTGVTFNYGTAGTAVIGGSVTENISNIRVNIGTIPTAYQTSSTTVNAQIFTPSTTPLTTVTGTVLLTCQSPTIVDNSSNAFLLTPTGSPIPRKSNPFGVTTTTNAAYSTSANGGTLFFDGGGDYLSVPISTAMNLTGDFTIECWVYTSTLSGNQGINASSGQRFGLIRLTNYFYWLGSTDLSGSSITINANSWYHVAVSRSGTTLRLFVNGIQANSGTYSEASTSNIWYVGSDQSNEQWNGYISNLRVVKGTAVYTSNFVPPQSPVTAITNTSLLLNGTNAGVSDNAMMYVCETALSTQISTAIKKFGTGSILFNGTTDYYYTKYANQAYAFNAGNFTVEMWLYPTAFATYKSLYGNSSGAASATGFHTGLNASGNVFIYSNSGFRLTTTNAMTLNAWNYVAIVRSGSTITVYINGTAGGTWTLTTQTFTDGFNYFGAAPGFASEFYTGYLDDFRITKGYARTVTSLPTAAFPNS